MRVLYVEDEIEIRECVCEFLTKGDFDVLACGSADIAAEQIKSTKFDLLLTDIRMPGLMDGIDLAFYARRLQPDIKIVITTGYCREVGSRTAMLGSRFRLLQKPFLFEDLLSAIRAAALDFKPGERQLLRTSAGDTALV